MRYVICIILLFIFIPKVWSQDIPVDSFWVPGARWTIAATSDLILNPTAGEFAEEWGCRSYVYGVIGDTIKSGEFYRKIGLSIYNEYYGRLDENSSNSPSCEISLTPTVRTIHFEYVGRVRIDSNKVYFTLDVPSTTFDIFHNVCGTIEGYTIGKEYLIYDGSAALNGYLYSEMFGPDSLAISVTDSVPLSNGKYVKRFNGSDSNFYWIWGIGSSLGTFGNYAYWDQLWAGFCTESPMYRATYTLCYQNPSFSFKFTHKDTLTYPALENSCFDKLKLPAAYMRSCDSDTIANTNSSNIDYYTVRIHPNPFSNGYLNISAYCLDCIQRLTIFDMKGRIFKELAGSLALPNPIHYNRYNRTLSFYLELPTGVYLLRATYDNGVVKYVKFVATPHGK